MPEVGKTVGLPPQPFLYTLDQIAFLLSVGEENIGRLVHYEGRSVGVCPRDKMLARNIASSGSPMWRVADRELVRFMKFKGFKYYERGYVAR